MNKCSNIFHTESKTHQINSKLKVTFDNEISNFFKNKKRLFEKVGAL